MPDDVLYAGVAELSRRIRAREISPVDLAEACLARAEALGPRLGCVVTLAAERARADARRAEQDVAAGRWRGSLHGIPYGLVDVVDTRGVRTTFGARPFAGRTPERDATVAARLAEAGGVLVAKLATLELAGALGCGSAAASLTGACRTPWDLSRWSGGPSSGPAAAVAAGIVPLAIAAEARGAMTCPAAFCGVTALRPTYGVVPRSGVMAAAYTMDRVGPTARSAADCATGLSAIAGEDSRDPSSVPPPAGLDRARSGISRGLRIGVVSLPQQPAPLPGAAEAYAAAQEVLREAGALLAPAALPELPYEAAASVIAAAEAATALEDVIRAGRTRELDDPSHRRRRPEEYEPRATSADYVRAQRVRGEVQRALAALFERHDLLLAPNLPWAPPRLDEPVDAIADPLAAAGSLAGVPAVAFPMGFSGALPLSMQLIAPPLEEVRLLSAAALFQARTSHHLQRPQLSAAAPAVAAGTPH
jgi:aspartyl-tRNA(Asn)/glutamyl-tRNA(Gln) amidotransferase subunit A